MKILITSQCFYPDDFRINDIVEELVLQGHDVTVLTGLPDYTTSKVPKEYKWFRNRRQNINGAKIIRVREFHNYTFYDNSKENIL